MGGDRVSVLIVEDDEDFGRMASEMAARAGLRCLSVAGSIEEGIAAIGRHVPSAAMLDLGLPDSRGGVDSVRRVCAACPSLPVVVMTGNDDEELGIEALKYGAQDYLVKNQFGWRELGKAVRYAVERKELLNEKEKLIAELKAAMKRVKQLTGLLPICSDCKKIRTEKGEWRQLESYISERSGAEFSHGFCEECYQKRKKEIEDL